jgi:hypothetical protein
MPARADIFFGGLCNDPRIAGAPLRCAALLGLALASWSCAAQAAVVEIYRCPGNPAVYTSDLRLVRAGRCTRLGGPVVATRHSAAPQAVASARVPPPAIAPPQRAPSGSATIARHVQQQRDVDRVHILQTELARERERLAQLTQQLRALPPARSDGAAAAHPDAVALSQAIQRSESDLMALDNELARTVR